MGIEAPAEEEPRGEILVGSGGEALKTSTYEYYIFSKHIFAFFVSWGI